jgi:hypothetical protein
MKAVSLLLFALLPYLGSAQFLPVGSQAVSGHAIISPVPADSFPAQTQVGDLVAVFTDAHKPGGGYPASATIQDDSIGQDNVWNCVGYAPEVAGNSAWFWTIVQSPFQNVSANWSDSANILQIFGMEFSGEASSPLVYWAYAHAEDSDPIQIMAYPPSCANALVLCGGQAGSTTTDWVPCSGFTGLMTESQAYFSSATCYQIIGGYPSSILAGFNNNASQAVPWICNVVSFAPVPPFNLGGG